MDEKLPAEYNEIADLLRAELRFTHAVAKLLIAEREGTRISLCTWPDFGPFVMPPCDVVNVVGLRRVHGTIVGGDSIGYISQRHLFQILGDLVREVRVPIQCFMCDVSTPPKAQDKIRAALKTDPDLK